MDEQCILAKVVTPTFLYSKFSCKSRSSAPKKKKKRLKIDGLHTSVYEKTKEKTPSWPVYFTWDIFNHFMR